MTKRDLAALRTELTRRGARRIAIDGCGGTGKSTLARLLAAGWPAALVVEMDDFETYRTADAAVLGRHVDAGGAAVRGVRAAGTAGGSGGRRRRDRSFAVLEQRSS